MYFNSTFYNKTWTVNHPCVQFLSISLRLGTELIIYIILLATKLFKCIFHLQVEPSLDIGGFMVIINKSCSREQHTQHIDAWGNLTFCGVWIPIPSLDQGHYLVFLFIFSIRRKCHPNYDLSSNLYPSVALLPPSLSSSFPSALPSLCDHGGEASPRPD